MGRATEGSWQLTNSFSELLCASSRRSWMLRMAFSSSPAPPTVCRRVPTSPMSMSLKLLSALTLAPLALSASAVACASPGLASLSLISLVVIRSYISPKNSGVSSPSSPTPRLFLRKPSLVILFFTCGLCASVLSMMTLYASTYAVSALRKRPGVCRQKRSANFSMSLSIFCASPGRRKSNRKWRIASSNTMPVKSSASTYACITLRLSSAFSPR
mmetsp:Transcript_4555/g.18274  ORF Transcript_4555/g.18274 Transcript_4555/m.18274 type:complete len:215 (+) Transcript_4555:2411-3055(+)